MMTKYSFLENYSFVLDHEADLNRFPTFCHFISKIRLFIILRLDLK